MPSSTHRIKQTAESTRKMELVQALLQQKTAELQQLHHYQEVLGQQEQVLTAELSQDEAFLFQIGRLMYKLPTTTHVGLDHQGQTMESVISDMQQAQVLYPAGNSTSSGLSGQKPTSKQLLRKLLSSPDIVQRICSVRSATLEELAGMIKGHTARLQELLCSAADSASDVLLGQQVSYHLELLLLLHMGHEKLQALSCLNLETMQPESPSFTVGCKKKSYG